MAQNSAPRKYDNKYNLEYGLITTALKKVGFTGGEMFRIFKGVNRREDSNNTIYQWEFGYKFNNMTTHSLHNISRTLLLFLCVVTSSAAQEGQKSFSLIAPQERDSLKSLSLWGTFYYIPSIESNGTIPFRNNKGTSLGLYADTCTFCKAALEGTVFVKDSNGKIVVLNFSKRADSAIVDCRKCKTYTNSKLNTEDWGKAVWEVSSGYGIGVQNFKLVPYRTIAVDKKLIPYGTVLFIPAAKGVKIKLPSGETIEHDGYFFAGDTGSGIKNNHIDIFIGISSVNPFSTFVKSKDTEPFKAYFCKDTTIIKYLIGEHAK